MRMLKLVRAYVKLKKAGMEGAAIQKMEEIKCRIYALERDVNCSSTTNQSTKSNALTAVVGTT